MKRILSVVAAACAVVAVGPLVGAQARSAPVVPGAADGCLPVAGAVCGTLRVPLVRARPELGGTTVGYVVIRHRDASRPAKGMIAANPGGPGDSAIASAERYVRDLGGLLDDHDLLLVDPRGVNRSDPVDCGLTGLPPTRDGFVRAVEACGRELGPRARGYTSAEVADDIDAVRAGLGVARLDLLGESYGSYLMAVYAKRHPARVRSMVLSSAFPLDFDMWGRPGARAMRRAIRLLCDNSGDRCDGQRVLRDSETLAGRLARRPVTYTTDDGQRRLLDDTSLAVIVFGAAGASAGFGDVPAMVRAALRGDHAPLVAAARRVGPLSGSSATRQEEQPFNPMHSMALMCNDYPTLWNRQAPVAARLRQYAARRRALPVQDFRPFGKRAWTSAAYDRGNTCVRWPDDGPAQATGGPFPDVPVLVLSGALDPNTPTEEGRQAARQFRHAAVVEVPHTGHVPTGEPTRCAAGIQRAFIRDLRVGDTSCLTRIPPVVVRP
ncbi:alpha/beta fold hydrolase [Spirillospora sp. CA-294931]|uniref:alpha/beta fold hydrolase n=1 Tax=Spirillospora sp. CA-294931 TaxID=3240042 RepID=UPI003D946B98